MRITPIFNFLFKWKPISISYYNDISYKTPFICTTIVWKNRFGTIISKDYDGIISSEVIIDETK